MKKLLIRAGIIVFIPILLFILAAVALYIPPVQNWIADKVAETASKKTGADISIGRVALSFPLDLTIHDFRMLKPDSLHNNRKDTIADIKELTIDVKLKPLFNNKVVISSIEINDTKINTTDMIAAASIKGRIGRLSLHSKGIDLDRETAEINNIHLYDTEIDIALSDSVPEDTSKTEIPWKIHADTLSILNTSAVLHMPGDTLAIAAKIEQAGIGGTSIDLKEERYEVRTINWNGGSLSYDNKYELHTDGLDYNHIALGGINIGIDSVLYHAPLTKLNIRQCAMKEKSGLEITRLTAPVTLDSTRVRLQPVILRTPDSSLEGHLNMELSTFDDKNPGKAYLRLMASIGKQDVMKLAGKQPDAFVKGYPDKPINIIGSVNGNMKDIEITGLDINLPTAFHIAASGRAAAPTDIKRLKATADIKAQTGNINFIKPLAGTAMNGINIPRNISMKAKLNANGAAYSAAFIINEGKGSINGKVKADTKAETYSATMEIDKINIAHFIADDSLGCLSANMDVEGKGFDFMSERSNMSASMSLRHIDYGQLDINGMSAAARLSNGRGHIAVNGSNQLFNGTVSIDALISRKYLAGTIVSDLREADFYRLRMTDMPLKAGVCAHIDIASDMKEAFKINGYVNDLTVKTKNKTYRPADLTVDAMTDRDTTWANMSSGNLKLNMKAKGGYKKLMENGGLIADEILDQIKNKVIDHPRIKKLYPDLSLYITSGNDNPFANFLRMKGIDFKDLLIDITSSPDRGLNGNGHVYSLTADSTKIDTVKFSIRQDSSLVRFNAQVTNNKNNPQFVFNTTLDGHIYDNGVEANIKYYDKNNRLGVQFGSTAEMRDSGIYIHATPYRPVIGYKEFNLNKDNYIFLGRNKRIYAKVDFIADDGTGVKIYSNDENRETLQDLTVSLNNFDLGKITSVLPYAPSITGMLNGDYHVLLNENEKVSVASDMSVSDMTYEKCPIGNLSTEFIYMQREDQAHYVEARINQNGRDIGILNGSYLAEGDGYLEAVFNMERLPLDIINGFIPDRLFGFKGYADGEVEIKGTLSKPQVDGEVYLDSSYIISVPYGVQLRADNDPVRIIGSNLLLENFTIYSYNNNPLNISGAVDFSDPEKMRINMKMKATNYQIIDAKQTSKSIAYGKAFVNFYGNVNGTADNLVMRGQLDVLGKTNMTYVLKDSPLNTDDQLKELVTFTNFNDTTQISTVNRPPINGLDMLLLLNIESGARIRCDLNANHSNYVDVEGGGELRMTYNTTDNLQLFGRYTLNDGEMKYALPIIPLKTFTIQKGSYIEFTGDIMNPRLNIEAAEETKTMVASETGNSRSVLFKCGVKVTKTLNDMGLEFTLDAPEDMTIKNDLAAMSTEQKNKLAITMLTTGMYISDGNTTGFSMNNALNSFLQSEIKNLTNSAMKTVDISVGLDQNSDAAGNTHTDYSFKFAKRFWNNRVNFIIGGKVSGNNSNTTQQDEAFIDNVSLEYRLDQTAQKYVRLFYNKDITDLLEDGVSEYGGGFVWRKKMNRLDELFKMNRPNRQKSEEGDSVKHKDTTSNGKNKRK